MKAIEAKIVVLGSQGKQIFVFTCVNYALLHQAIAKKLHIASAHAIVAKYKICYCKAATNYKNTINPYENLGGISSLIL